MIPPDDTADAKERHAPANLSADEFRTIGHQLVDSIAGFIESLT